MLCVIRFKHLINKVEVRQESALQSATILIRAVSGQLKKRTTINLQNKNYKQKTDYETQFR